MKFVILFLLCTATCIPQFFNDLRGVEDQSNNTHLFYKILYKSVSDTFNSIYHLDVSTNTETLFLEQKSVPGSMNIINDYDFWDRDPSKFIYSETTYDTDTTTEIIKYSGEVIFNYPGVGGNIELSMQDTNVVFIEAGGFIYKTINSGSSWDKIQNGKLLSVSPFNHNIIFSLQNDSLFKSNNGGNNFYLVNQSVFDALNKFIYDKNGFHIYTSSTSDDGFTVRNHLYISNNAGEPYSWSELTGDYHFYDFYNFTIDTSVIGRSYFFIKPEFLNSIEIPLKISHDFGSSFLNYDTVNYKPCGIYTKPGTNTIFSISSRDLYEITPGNKEILKHLEINPLSLSYYPLKNGTKWVYNYWDWEYPRFETYDFFVEVKGDTLLNDGHTYKKLWNSHLNSYYYQRIDSVEALVYEYGEIYPKYNLNMALGDLFMSDKAVEEFKWTYGIEFWGSSKNIKIYLDNIIDNATQYQLMEGIGLQSKLFSYFAGQAHTDLKGMIMDGVVYGDTVITDVNDAINNPTSFILHQNYPNPFNPATTIKFYLPKQNFITLKVFDILGNEISTLINEELVSGEYSIPFDGKGLSSGVYFYVINGEGINQTRKMTLLK